MSRFHPIFVSFLLSIMLTPLCHALSGSFFRSDDSNCTGHYPGTILTYTPTQLTPLLPGYCYPMVQMYHQYYSAESIAAYCDADGTAHITVYQDEDCTQPKQVATGAEGTCLPLRNIINTTETTMHIRINCTHAIPTRFTNPGPYVNVSATYYSSSFTCNDSSPSTSIHHIPSSRNRECIDVKGAKSSFQIKCDRNQPEMDILTGCKLGNYDTTLIIRHDSIDKTCTSDRNFISHNNSTQRPISARIDCGAIPYNGKLIRYPQSNQSSYIVTGVNYQRTDSGYRCDDDSSWRSFPTSFGPFQSGSCQVFANNQSSYMVTCSSDGSGQGRINVFQNTTTCDTKHFFSFAEGTANGKTCLPFSMSNGDMPFQQQSATILCKLNSSSPLYHYTYTHMVLLCALMICINAFASI